MAKVKEAAPTGRREIVLTGHRLRSLLAAASRIPVEKLDSTQVRLTWVQNMAALQKANDEIELRLSKLSIIHKARSRSTDPNGEDQESDWKDPKAYAQDLETLLRGTKNVKIRPLAQSVLEGLMDWTESPIKDGPAADKRVPPVAAALVSEILPLFNYSTQDEETEEEPAV